MSSVRIDDVVDFWRDAGPQRWFAQDDGFDAEFSARFLEAHHAAARCELDAWANSANGTLALLILLDQLPRNAFRGSAHMFATDALALSIAHRAVQAGQDREVQKELRSFLYMPMMHAESLAEQHLCCEQMRQFGGESLKYAEIHRDIIERFGRFPHRNPMLGRDTTPAEQAFLDGGGFSG